MHHLSEVTSCRYCRWLVFTFLHGWLHMQHHQSSPMMLHAEAARTVTVSSTIFRSTNPFSQQQNVTLLECGQILLSFLNPTWGPERWLEGEFQFLFDSFWIALIIQAHVMLPPPTQHTGPDGRTEGGLARWLDYNTLGWVCRVIWSRIMLQILIAIHYNHVQFKGLLLHGARRTITTAIHVCMST